MKLTKLTLIVLALLCLLLPLASATCTYAVVNDSTDIFNVNTLTANETEMTTSQLWLAWRFFTPRTNFTIRLTESITGKLTGENTTFATTSFTNFSSTLDIYNSTNLIDPSNYTLINPSGKVWAVQWKVNDYNGTTLSAIFNRTFVACRLAMVAPTDCDDLYLAPEGIRTAYTMNSFLVQNTPVDYGDSKTYRFNPATPLASYMNNTNWAVGWQYREATCAAETSCQSPINSTIYNILAGIFMLGMLVFIVFSVINGADTKVIIGTVVAALIMLVALQIINGLIQAMCVVPAP